jgi:hypothetical protein
VHCTCKTESTSVPTAGVGTLKITSQNTVSKCPYKCHELTTSRFVMDDELHISQMFCTHNASLVRHTCRERVCWVPFAFWTQQVWKVAWRIEKSLLQERLFVYAKQSALRGSRAVYMNFIHIVFCSFIWLLRSLSPSSHSGNYLYHMF